VKERLQQLVDRLLPTVVAGIALAGLEAGMVAFTRPELFLSIREFARYWLIITCVSVSLLVIITSVTSVLGGLLWHFTRERFALAVALTTGVLAAPLTAWLFWLLTQGRRVRMLPYRPIAVSGAALLASLLLMAAVLGWLRVLRAARWARISTMSVLWVSCAAALWADGLVLHRLYPALHWALSALALVLCAAASRMWPLWQPESPRTARWLVGLGVLGALAGPFLLRAVSQAPNLRYAVAEAAPLTGKLLHLVRKSKPTFTRSAQPTAAITTNSGKPGVSLRGDDILIITIDALRVDRLRAYGAHQDVTPEIDRLAQSAAVFEHAYTPTPHTSYAIGSLWTGKYLRPVLSLPAASKTHETLPNLVRRFGYRTAAFYPPAVFFVDEDRFAGLAEDHFGFEYVKEQFAPAHERVTQLQQYLEQAPSDHPLLVWMHLFEPHEPYEAKPELARGTEPEQRYDAEVAAADSAAGEMIALFRKRNPNATVIVTADHGEEFGEHGGHHHGTTLFEEQVRVPLIWSSPGRVQPRRIQSPAQLVDIAPTLLAALAIPRDPRMRGADLTGLLNGAPENPKLHAFASIEELRMLTDGRDKLICEASEGSCRLYDLAADPSESRDASERKPEVAERLRGKLSELVASIPDGEVLAMEGGEAWPKALALARLGDRAARDELLPLLSDKRAVVRAEALRALTQAHMLAALPLVRTLADKDSDPGVRAEAALAAFSFGASEYAQRVRSLLTDKPNPSDQELDLARRAAFALAPTLGKPGEQVLFALAADSGAGLGERERALATLGEAKAAGAVRKLAPLLDDVRLRPAVARALGMLGDPAAVDILLRALGQERYPEARAAEVQALVQLKAKRVLPRIVRFLGTETGLPGGLEHWAQLQGGQGRSAGGQLFDLRRGAVVPPGMYHGEWTCRKKMSSDGPPGCRPNSGRTQLQLPRRLLPGEGRVVFAVWASSSSDFLRVAEREYALHRGRNELAYPLKRPIPATLPVQASPNAFIELIGLVPKTPDIAPPPPEVP
jgi:arylsulfatase A-like enzyme/HEAT repeat protein